MLIQMIRNNQASLWLLAVALVWGTSYGVTKQALVFVSVFTFIFLRFGITFVLALPWVWREITTLTASALVNAVALGLVLFTIFCFETYGVLLTTASNAAVLISLCIVFTPIFERFFLKTELPPRLFSAIALSVLGIALLNLNGLGLTGLDIMVLNTGDLLILIAAIIRGFIVVVIKRFFNQHEVSALVLTTIQSGTVALCAGILAFGVLGESTLFPTSLTFWLLIGYLVVFATLLAFVAKNIGIRHTSATRASFLMGTEPLFGLLFAVLWLSEPLTLLNLLGAACIILATYWVLLDPKGRTSANTNPSRSTTSPT
jgi:drug/metabolite transporter (DMT)-like permease